MRGAAYFAAAALLAGVAFWSYRVNYSAQEALDRVEDLRAEIAHEREAVAVLRAEVAHLAAPDRLRGLVSAQTEALGLVPLEGAAFAMPEDLPFPPPDAFWVRADPSIFMTPAEIAP